MYQKSEKEIFKEVDFKILKDKIIVNIEALDDSIFFLTACGCKFIMFHEQECCEQVYIESISQDYMKILLNEKILFAEENINSENFNATNQTDKSYIWTFYKLATSKGFVDIRWYGNSNGYYSEKVNFKEITTKPSLTVEKINEIINFLKEKNFNFYFVIKMAEGDKLGIFKIKDLGAIKCENNIVSGFFTFEVKMYLTCKYFDKRKKMITTYLICKYSSGSDGVSVNLAKMGMEKVKITSIQNYNIRSRKNDTIHITVNFEGYLM